VEEPILRWRLLGGDWTTMSRRVNPLKVVEGHLPVWQGKAARWTQAVFKAVA
jgi:hypothetical protein